MQYIREVEILLEQHFREQQYPEVYVAWLNTRLYVLYGQGAFEMTEILNNR